MIDLNSLKQFTELQQEQVKESILNTASIAEIIGVLGMSDIVEKGDGYIRFENGVQLCWGNISFTSSSKSWGHLYENIDAVYENYPKSFKSAPTVTAGSIGEGYCMIESAGGNNERTPNFFAVKPASFTNLKFTISYIAIGLWKEI
jgi:hypothetical protein